MKEIEDESMQNVYLYYLSYMANTNQNTITRKRNTHKLNEIKVEMEREKDE